MKLTEIELVESYSADQQLMKLTFDNGKDTAYIIWSHADLLQHLNDEVIATFRKELYNGVVSKFVNTMASVCNVTTLEREDNVKFYTDVTDNHSNIQFVEIEDGCTAKNAIVYVVGIRFDSSARADWADLTIMDRARKLSTLRIFSPDSRAVDLKGRYVMCDIRRNKYGLSTDSVVTVDSAFPRNPEVEIAERFIMSAFASEEDVLRVLSDSQFIAFAREAVDEEPGYLLVRLAVEIAIANELSNLMKEADMKLIRLCLLMEKFSVLHQNSPYDKNIITFIVTSKHNFRSRSEALLVLCSEEPKFNVERAVIKQVKELADTVVRAKKGLIK